MSRQAEKRYRTKAYDRMSFSIPRGAREVFSVACEANGKTMQGVVNEFIRTYCGIAKEDWTYKRLAPDAECTGDNSKIPE